MSAVCGAPRAHGGQGNCNRRVKAGQRCWQHRDLPVAVVRGVRDGDLRYHMLLLWCPGCAEAYQGFGLHAIRFQQEGDGTPTPCWTFDGNLEAPTVSPSLLVRSTWNVDGTEQQRVCHTFIIGGQWQFLPDCTHALAGQTLPLPPVPRWVVREGR